MTNTTRYSDLKTKSDRVAYIRGQLKVDIRWATRALVRVYEKQTEDEKQTDSTHHLNKVGFSGADAEILSSFARQVLAGRNLSEKQRQILFQRIPKYAGQLEKIASE